MFVAENGRQRADGYRGSVSSLQRIAFVLTDACDLLGVAVVAEALDCASELAGVQHACKYGMQFLSANGGPVKCHRSFVVSTGKLADTIGARFACVFVAAGPNADEVCNGLSHAAWLQRIRAAGTPVRFLAADTVNGFAHDAAHPSERDRIVQGAQANARLSGAIRAAFEIIRDDMGEPIAREALHRTVSGHVDTILSSIDTGMSTADKVHAAGRWLKNNCHRPVSVADAAHACAMSQRTLLRYFQACLGTSPSEYLQRARLDLACALLAETSLPADKIARRVGLTDGGRLGKLFRRCIGKSPTEYRAWQRARTDGLQTIHANEQPCDVQADMEATQCAAA
ncbi:helix-turn-helix domain-containing protein [Paraburkholderia sp. CNPSo 3157]|uniref:Helix-turn-helix domain-containing protein n=1 Tax=Paraburkholderia franconis TaxID=2654983 RepID=A0A7X1THK6_9BURK|nr:helix-turn-helix domain-containing protein [Paraburkholderia franconis]MPW19635.1 helix-turn-helix domain-containing protein [Paraburkholderia franconis]